MICIYEVYKLILKYLTEELPEAFQHSFLYSVVLFIEYYLYRKKVYHVVGYSVQSTNLFCMVARHFLLLGKYRDFMLVFFGT